MVKLSATELVRQFEANKLLNQGVSYPLSIEEHFN